MLFGIDDPLTQQAPADEASGAGLAWVGLRVLWVLGCEALVKLEKFPALMCDTVPTLEVGDVGGGGIASPFGQVLWASDKCQVSEAAEMGGVERI